MSNLPPLLRRILIIMAFSTINRINRRQCKCIVKVDLLTNGAPVANGVDHPSMPRELADSEPTVDQRRYWPTVRNIPDARPISKAVFPSRSEKGLS